VPQPFRSNGFVLGQLSQSRALGVNYLLGIGPMPDGDLEPESYANMALVQDWMKINGAAIKHAKPLADSETASVPATGSGSTRYLFALPKFSGTSMYEKDILPPVEEKLTLTGVTKPAAVTMLRDGSTLAFTFADGSITLPASKRTKLVDVVRVDLAR
jgi:alpha-L-fucosidase